VTAVFGDHLYVEEMDNQLRDKGGARGDAFGSDGWRYPGERMRQLQTQADGERCIMYASLPVE
jgi:hypothetical protein